MSQGSAVVRRGISGDKVGSGGLGIAAFLWVWRWWVICSVIACTTAAMVLAFVVTPVYRASVLLAPTAAERSGTMGNALGQLGGIASMVGVNLKSGDAQTQEALAILKSREFTVAFIKTNNLMPELFKRKWNSQSRHWEGASDSWPTSDRKSVV